MPDQLKGRKVAILVTDGVEQVELTEPRGALEGEGATVHIVSTRSGEIQGFRHLDKADRFKVDRDVRQARPEEYDALVLPGGVANPDALRTDAAAIAFVKAFAASGKPIGAICHGPWTLVEADAVRGRTLTSWPSLKTDIRNAGGSWVDEEVHTDMGLVTSRKPDDLPAFCAKLIEEIREGSHADRQRRQVEAEGTEEGYDEVVADSFPASDPPSSTPLSGVGGPSR
jgi:protease I